MTSQIESDNIMSQSRHPVRMDEIAWKQIFPWLRLFHAFRMAIRPSKIGLALILLTLIFLLGHSLDVMWGAQAYPREIDRFRRQKNTQFDHWRQNQTQQTRADLVRLLRTLPLSGIKPAEIVRQSDPFQASRKVIHDYFNKKLAGINNLVAQQANQVDMRKIRQARNAIITTRRKTLTTIAQLEPAGIFQTAFRFQLQAFDRLVNAAISLRFGFQQILAGSQTDTQTVVGAIRDLIVVLPAWMCHTHPWFAGVYGLILLLLFSILGGTIARLAALDATDSSHVSVMAAMRFVAKRYAWYVLTPLFPALFAGGLAILLAAGGLVFFNLPALDIIGGGLFFMALLMGFSMALLGIFTLAGHPLFYPALSIEGTDCFDAVSRSFGYLIARPWHWLFYSVLSLVYGAIGYVFIGAVIFLTMRLTHYFVGMGVLAHVAEHVGRWDVMMPTPRLGQLLYTVDWYAGLDFTGKLSAGLIWVWCFFLTGIIGAYSITFYYCSNVLIYLLMRQSADKTNFDEIAMDHLPVSDESAETVPEKSEPRETEA